MHMMRGPGRNLAIELRVERVDLGCPDLLQRSRAQGWHDVTAQQFGVAFEGAAPHLLLPASRRTGGDPLFCPLSERELAGIDVRAVVAALEQPAQLLARVQQRAVE